MADYILDLLNANETVNYSLILSFVAAYIIFMWFIVSIWLLTDARKRYKSGIQPILYAIFVLFFGPPALIFYIMIRPEHTLDEDYYINLALSGEKQSRPIYFDGERGFDINVNLSVQPKETSEDNKHKMNVEVSWMPKEDKTLVSSKPVKVKSSSVVGLKKKLRSLSEEISKTVASIFTSNENNSKPKIDNDILIKKESSLEEEDISTKTDLRKKKRSKRKKKKKRKKK